MFLLNYGGVFVLHFNVLIFGLNTKKNTFSKLRVANNNVYRKVFCLKRRNSASEMFVLTFTTRLTNSKNAIIYTIQRSWVFRDLT